MTGSNKLIKVVYFDEDSALEYLDILNDGRYLFNDEIVENAGKSFENTSKMMLEGNIKFKNALFGLIGFGMGGSNTTSGEISKNNNKILKTTVSNTILTDFVGQKNADEIKEFSNYNLTLKKNSFAYLKTFTPYLKMLKDNADDSEEIEMKMLDETLNDAKGYYEILASKDKEEVVLRFNNFAFRNNYSVGDLQTMKITCYAIEVGKINKKTLDVKEFFASFDSEEDTNTNEVVSVVQSYEKLKGKEQEQDDDDEVQEDNDVLALYDVVLAGVTTA